MKYNRILSFSFVSFLLVVASAVTAALLPNSDSNAPDANNGTLVNGPGATTDGWTCIAREGNPQSCTEGDSGGTTSAHQVVYSGSSLTEIEGIRDTRNNISNDAYGYATSITEPNLINY